MKKSITILFVIIFSMALLEIGISYISQDSNVPELTVNDISSAASIKESYKMITLYEESYVKNSGISWSYNKYLKKATFISLNSLITINDIGKFESSYLNPSLYCNQTLRMEIKFDDIEQEVFRQRTRVYEEKLRDQNATLEENASLTQKYNENLKMMDECLYLKSSKAISSNVFSRSITESIFFPEYFQLSEFSFTKSITNNNTNGIDAIAFGGLLLVDKVGSLGMLLFEEEPFSVKDSLGNEILISQKERKEKALSTFKDAIQLSTAYDTIEYGNTQENILYASYYPYYKKILLIIKTKDTSALEDARVSVGNKEYTTETNYPLVIVNDVTLDEGEYTLRLKTASKVHTIPVKVQYPPFVGGGQISTNNKFSFGLTSTTQNRITIEQISITNIKLGINCTFTNKTEMTYMETKTIELNCPNLEHLEKDIAYVYDISIDYSDEQNKSMTSKGSMKVYLNSFDYN